MVGIYKIENKINNKVYIGSSKSIENRWKQHIKELQNNKHHCERLQFDFNKYGVEFFNFTVETLCEEENVLDVEYDIITKYFNLLEGDIYNTKLKKSKPTVNQNGNDKFLNIPIGNIEYKSRNINADRILFLLMLSDNNKYNEISVKEISNNFKTSENNIYRDKNSIIESLLTFKINGISIFDECCYEDGVFVIRYNDYDYGYNRIKISANNAKMNSIYTMKAILNIKNITEKISVDEFKDIISAHNNSYNKYSLLKIKVINPLLEDLKNLNLKISLQEIKTHNKVTHLLLGWDKD